MERRRRRALLAAVTGLAAGNVVAVGVGEAQAQPVVAAAQSGGALPQTAATAPAGTTGVLYFRQQHGNNPAVQVPMVASVSEDGKTIGSAPTGLDQMEDLPVFSPDGTKVAYGGIAGIQVGDPAFTTGTTLVPPANGQMIHAPKWLAGGARLAYLVQDTTTQKSTIWTVAADGSGAAALPLPGTFATANIDEFDVTPNGDYVFRTTSVGGSEADFYHPGNAAVTPLLTGNIGPIAADPDGLHATVEVVDTGTPANGGAVKDIDLATKAATPLAAHLNPNQPLIWSPDGKELAFSHLDALATSFPTPGAIHTDHLVLLDKATGTPTDVVTPDPTLANNTSSPMSWQILPAPIPPSGVRAQVDRVGGGDRVATAVDTSQLAFNNAGAGGRQAAAAVLSRSDTFADALAGSALAAHKGGPLLLTGTGSLDPAVRDELVRVLPAHANVYLLGGTSALSVAVLNQVAALGFTPVRVWGADRDATAVEIAKQITAHPHTFLVGTGRNFPDALAAGAAAGAQPDAVVLLSDDGRLPKVTADYLTANHQTGDALLGVGVQASDALKGSALAGQITQEFRGHDRFDTATQLADHFYSGPFPPKTVGVATGYNWPDALGGGALLGAHPGPLLLDGTTGLPQNELDYLTANGAAVQEIVVFGGAKVVPQTDVDGAANHAKGTGNWDYHENRPAPALP